MVVQSLLTATTDLHVYWLGKRVVAAEGGGGGREVGKAEGEAVGRWALFFQCSNWFMWYAGVRTFSSSFEMALLVPAVYHWLSLANSTSMTKKGGMEGAREAAYLPAGSVSWEEPLALVLGALSIVVRPTALFAWLPLGLWRMYHTRFADLAKYLCLVVLPWTGLVFVGNVLLDSYCYSLLPSLGAGPSSSSSSWDWLVITPLNFLRINLVADVASQYGTHPVHWYFTLGGLTVLTTHLPFLLLGLRRAFSPSSSLSPFSSAAATSLWLLALVVVICPLGLSLSPHKEFRFLLPVLPLAFVLAGTATVNDILPSSPFSPPPFSSRSPSSSPSRRNRREKAERGPFLLLALLLSSPILLLPSTSLESTNEARST